MALQSQIISIPVSEGLDTKTDSKQVMAGKALVLENARFQKTGKLSKRFGLVSLTNSANTGTLDSNTVSAVVSDQDYIATVTNNGVYALSEGDNQWYKQNAFSISGKVETRYIFKNYFDQKAVDFDITPDGTHAAYIARQEKTNFGSNIIVCLEDTSTGLIKYSNVTLASSNCGINRVIVVKDSGFVKVHAFYYDGTNILRTIYDKDMNELSTTTIIAFTDLSQFDLCKDTTKIFFAKIVSTTIDLKSYDFAGALITSATDTVINSIGTGGGVARGMCITTSANNLHVAWCRNSGVTLKGYTKLLVASITESSLGTGGQTCVSMVSTSTGLTVCSSSDGPAPDEFFFETYTFTTTYVNTFITLYYRLTLCSQPFNYLNKNFVICRSVELNNKSFFIFNLTDGYIAQRFSPDLAVQNFISSTTPISMVPKSVLLNGVLKTALERVTRQNVTDDPLTDFFSTSGLSSSSIDFTNGSGDNSKQSVGGRIYLTSGATIEMDKSNPHENGFVISPNIIGVVQNSFGTANPNIASKTFSYVHVYEYTDSAGNITRSSPSPAVTITTDALAVTISVSRNTTVASLKNQTTFFPTNKYSSSPAIVTYRTLNNGSIFYKVDEFISAFNDGQTTIPFVDALSDATIQNNQTLYTTGNVLQNDPAPSCRFSTAGGNRVFLGGLEEKDEIAYSKKQLFGESVAFSDLFRIRISSGTSADKSKLSALGYMDGKLIVFRNRSIYYVAGDGPLETGADDTFTNPEIISSDTGCEDPRSVLNFPGGLLFKSKKGIYLLDRSFQVSYKGAPVEDFNSEHVVASVLSEKFNECRFYTDAGNCLVYNYLFDAWSVFTNQTIVDADEWQGSPVSIKSNRIHQETENTFLDGADYYSMKFTSPWLKLGNVQGYQRCYNLWIIGEFYSPHTLNCKIYTDYNDASSEDYELVYNDSSSPQYQFQISLPDQKVESVKFEIFDSEQEEDGESFDLSNIQAEVAVKAGGYKLAANKSY